MPIARTRFAGRISVALLLLATACQQPPPAPAEPPTAASGASPFYVWDKAVPERPGQLLREEPLEPGLVLENAASGRRLLYSSESFSGAPTVVSGALFLPKGDTPEGGWPVLAWSHGTVGIADVCAPSFRGRSARDQTYLNHWLAQGYAIVATDYEGLGTRGAHPYLHCASEAFGNIDGASAAQQIDAPLANRWLVLGQSQGGQGALCTGARASERAPQLDFVGTLATAPGVNFLELLGTGALEVPLPFLGLVLVTMHGMDTIAPAFSAEATLSKRAGALLPLVEETCTAGLIAEVRAQGFTDTSIFALPLGEAPGITDATAQMEIPLSGWDRPVLIAHGAADALAPPEASIEFSAALCEAGVDVTLKIYPGEGHSGPMEAGLADFTEWVAARFAGEPATNNCAIAID